MAKIKIKVIVLFILGFMKLKELVLFITLLFAIRLSYSSNTPSPKIRFFDENSGFETTNFISDIQVDSKGLVWIINFNGISIYDGNQFKNINTSTVSHASLLRFFEGVDNQKFVIDYLGALFFIEKDTLRPYKYNNLLKSFKAKNGFNSVYFDQENRLHISYKGVGYIIIDNGKVLYPLAKLGKQYKGDIVILREKGSPFYTQVAVDSTTAAKRNLYLFDENLKLIDSLSLQKSKYFLPFSLSQFGNYYILSDGKRNLIRFTKSGDLQLINYNQPISKILFDQYSGVWISTPNRGVKYYNSIHNLNTPLYSIFEGYTATASAVDKEGGVWVYSSEKGLAHISYPKYIYYSTNEGFTSANSVYGIEKVGNSLVFTVGGTTIYRVNETNYIADSISLNIPKEHIVYNIYFDKQEEVFWLACREALYFGSIETNTWTKLKTNKLEDKPGSIFKILGRSQELNAMIFALEEQYFLVRDSMVQFVSKVYPNVIFDLETIGDSLIIGAEDGLYIEHKGSIENLSEKYSSLSERVYSITKIDNRIYVSQRKVGLYRLGYGEIENISYNEETIQKAAVFKIDENSLLVIAKQGSFILKEDTLALYARLPRIVSGNFIYRDSSIYWGTWKEGVLKTPLNSILKNAYNSPYLFVNKILIDGKVHPIEQKQFLVDYNKGLFQFYYSVINYQNWEIKYRYRLLGLNSEWTETDERNVQYTTLPAGSYSFQLQAKKGNQFWSDSIVYEFTVLPPFWKTWWFISLTILFLLTITTWIISIRIKRIKREKDLVIDRLQAEQRALRAQMNPHFVFNIVSSAQYLVMKEKNEKAIHFLGMFSKLMRNILDYSNNSFIQLEEEIAFLKNYIELEQMRMENSFSFTIETEVKHYKLLLPPFLIQPFIENAIHHGLKDKEGEKTIKLFINYDNKYLEVIIEDNGIGRKSSGEHASEAKKARKSHGIRIIKERLKLNNNRQSNNLEIEDLYDKNGRPIGTKVKLKIKINDEGINS